MSTTKGPLWTTSNLRTINGEDHLGIRFISIAIADTLQSGVTSITPRARYWSFFAWVLHDFIQNYQDEKSLKNFKLYLQRQEWFFILANIAEAEERGAVTQALVGSTKGYEHWKKNELEYLVEEYVKNSFGGYAVYRNVMKILGLTREGDLDKGVQIDRLTELGTKAAKAFEMCVSSTEYYKSYRLSNGPVPRAVLCEFGKAAALPRLYSNQAKDLPILIELFMPQQTTSKSESLRRNSFQYYLHVLKRNKGKILSFMDWQREMYDWTKRADVPQGDMQTIACGWEIYQARQLFTYSLECMWSFLLERMSEKIYTMEELIGTVFKSLRENGHNISQIVGDMTKTLQLNSEKREEYIQRMYDEEQHVTNCIWTPLHIMLSVHKRLHERSDFQQLHRELLGLGGKDNISLAEWEHCVSLFQHERVEELLAYIIKYYILEQHQKVALNKLITTKNETYHFVENDGKLYWISNDVPAFNTFRVFQGLSIMQDLGFISEINKKYVLNQVGSV